MILSCSFLLRMRNVSDKRFRDNRNTHFVFNNFFPRKSCRLWDNVEKYCRARHRPQMTIWRIHISCWIPKATDTHSEYVIPIAFPRQQWLHERALMLRYTFIACLFSFSRAREFVCFYFEFHNIAASGWWSQDCYIGGPNSIAGQSILNLLRSKRYYVW